GDAHVDDVAVDPFAAHAGDLDLGALEGDYQRLARAFANDGQIDGGAGLAAHHPHRLVEAETLYRRVVEPGDDVAALDAGAMGRGVVDRGHDLDQPVLEGDLDAETAEAALRADLDLLEHLRVEIRRVWIEPAEHAVDGLAQQVDVADFLDVVVLDQAEYLGEDPQFLDRQWRRLLRLERARREEHGQDGRRREAAARPRAR